MAKCSAEIKVFAFLIPLLLIHSPLPAIMKKRTYILTIFLILNLISISAQTKTEIDSLLNIIISKSINSKNIIQIEQAKKIKSYGEKVLFHLSYFFENEEKTEIKSECQNRNLLKGEVAIIIADRIEFMPYFKLTGVQNCLMSFCPNNPNLIEYYFRRKPYGKRDFKEKYIKWLFSKDRLKLVNKKERIKRKKIITEWKSSR